MMMMIGIPVWSLMIVTTLTFYNVPYNIGIRHCHLQKVSIGGEGGG